MEVFLEDLTHKIKTVGIKQTMKAIENGKIQTVLIAEDADEKVVSNIKDICGRNGIEIKTIDTMKKLGKVCGIDVGAAVAGLLINE